MKKFFQSLKKSFLEAFSKNEYFLGLEKKYPASVGFIRKRLSFAEPYGFSFTIGILISALFFIYFLGVAQDILTHEPFVGADVRIMNLVAALRNMKIANVFLFLTYLANWQIIMSSSIAAIVILGLLRKKREIIFFTATLISGEIIYSLFKLLIHRQRPDIRFSLIPENGYTFPSGHAVMSVVFYGMIGYFVYKICKKWWQKMLLFIAFITLIFLIGLSRIYLGVHWVSDITAGWLIGFAILIFFITLFKQRERSTPEIKGGFISKKSIAIIVIVLSLAEGSFVYYFYRHRPLKLQLAPPKLEKMIIISPSENLKTVILSDNFPKFSESLIGEKMEPINFIMVGSKEKLIQVFQTAGWFVADKPNPRTLYYLVTTAIFNRPYLTAPVTPSFLNSEPETIAFEKPTEANTVKQRHHIRFWLTNFHLDKKSILVATASFDDGLEYLITHKIRPDVDTERDFIKEELFKTGLVSSIQEIGLVKPLLGENQSGDQFFTDGKAYIIFLQ